jgi:hypothetical protein
MNHMPVAICPGRWQYIFAICGSDVSEFQVLTFCWAAKHRSMVEDLI